MDSAPAPRGGGGGFRGRGGPGGPMRGRGGFGERGRFVFFFHINKSSIGLKIDFV